MRKIILQLAISLDGFIEGPNGGYDCCFGEISLAVHPILLGAGKPLFHDIQGKIDLHLLDTKSFSSGLVSLTYQVE